MICKECGRDLPETEFYRYKNKNKLYNHCKRCHRKILTKNNQERIRKTIEAEKKDLFFPQYVKPYVDECCSLFSITEKELFSKCKFQRYSMAKKWFCQKLRKIGYTIPKICAILSVHHSTVIYSIKEEQIKIVKEYLKKLKPVEVIEKPVIKRINYKTGEIILER